MADLKAVFIIMFMVNVGVMIIFSTGIVGDTSGLVNRSKETLGAYYTTSGDNYTTSGDPIASDLIANSSSWGYPTTEDQETTQTILRTDNPLKMIGNGLVLILKSMFGLLYVLVSVNAPLFIIWLIGVPFTMIYILSGIMFIRGVN